MRVAAVFMVLLPGFVSAQSAAGPDMYDVRPDNTTISFTAVKWLVMREGGTFDGFNGTIAYDPAHSEHSSVEIVVFTASLDSHNRKRDEVLQSSDFLDVQQYPTMRFHSTNVRLRAPDTLDITGDFTLHGITNSITVPVRVTGLREVPHVGRVAGFEAQFAINRRAYGVLGARWSAASVPGAISDEIEIHIVAGVVMRSSPRP